MKESVVTKLALRETRGTMQPHLRGNRLRFFKKCPQRFCLPLESILDVNGAIKKGHVILGFTKNGRYLISYCLKIDNDDSSPLPCYIYSLHWWEFNQHRPLVQVFTVSLFDKEEIHQDLILMVAESQDESKLVVYGEIRSVKDAYDQSHQCYVTVCAAPSPRPCPGCQYTPLGGITEKCLKHSFVVHFKYDLLPPFPIFNPSISLKMEDTVLFNTGDFLMAIKISTFDNNNNLLPELSNFAEGQQAGLSCTVCSNETVISHIPCQCSTAADVDRCQSAGDISCNQVCDGKNITCDLCSTKTDLPSKDSGSKANDEIVTVHEAVSTVKQAHLGNKHLDRHKVVSGFVNELNKIHSEGISSHEVNEEECVHLSTSQQIVNSKDDSARFDMGLNDASLFGEQTEQCNNNDMLDGVSKVITEPCTCSSAQNSPCFMDASCSLDKTEAVAPKSTCSTVTVNSSRNHVHNNTEYSYFFETEIRAIDYNSNCDLDLEHPKKVPHTQCSSCSCDVLAPTLNNNNLTLSVLKVYTETNNDSLDELPDVSDEFDMYDGSPPITVKTCHGRTLKQIGKMNQSNPNPTSHQLLREQLDSRMLHEQTLAVHQVTLDLEQCINELIQAHEGLRDSYKSLKDYDVQIVGVCPDSHEVIVMARILVYTRTRQRSASCGLPVSPSPVLQCTGFIFSWDVCGGAVRILEVQDLDAYSEQRKMYGKFNMAAKEASELRAKFFIPQSISSFVQAFSNHTVFTGKSLKYLRHPFLPLVLVL